MSSKWLLTRGVAALAVLGLVSSAHAAVVARYALDETEGPVVRDSAGAVADDATQAGSAGWVYGQPTVPAGTYGSLVVPPGIFGTAAGLSAASGEWKTAPGPEMNALVNDFTAMAWVRPDTVTGVKRIAGRSRLGTAGNNGWSFGLDGAEIRLTGHAIVDLDSPGTGLTAGNWGHIAITKSSTGGVTFYFNGDVIGQVTTAQAMNDFLPVAGNDPAWLLANTFGGQNFLGLMDEIRVYDSVLTTEQIRTEAVSVPPVVPEPAALTALAAAMLLLTRKRPRRD